MTSVRLVCARFTALGLAMAIAVIAPPFMQAQSPPAPLAIDTARITLAGTSNVHDYTASTTDARVTRAAVAGSGPEAATWEVLQQAGGLTAFDLSIAAASLTSPRDGVDKNMHKALKVTEHANITFSLKRLEGTAGALTATGTLRIAGVSREVTLPLRTAVKGPHLVVTGALDVLMPDFGIEPPKAMLGMVRANPKVTVTFEVVLATGTT